MTTRLVEKTITIHILPNISGRKGNQTIKFFFFKNHAEISQEE